MKIIVLVILFLLCRASSADECTGTLNAYLDSLDHIIMHSDNEEARQRAIAMLENIRFQRLVQNDCDIRSDILGIHDEGLPLNDVLNKATTKKP